jgi:hypothetical protein
MLTPEEGLVGVDEAPYAGRARTALAWARDGRVSDHELVEAMVAARRLAARAQAVELAAVAELARRRFAADQGCGVEVVSPREYVCDEVAQVLSLTAASADDLVRFATELTGRLPGTFTALANGDIDYGKARTLWHGTDQLSAEHAANVETSVLPRARLQTTGQIRAKIRRLIRKLDPDAASRRREKAERQRSVQLTETDDGTAYLTGADLPAEAASAAYGRITAIAAGLKHDGDTRKIDQLRADVYLALLRGTLTTTEPPADSTDRPADPGGRSEPGWSDADDTAADVIAEATRTELDALTGAPPEPQLGAVLAQASTRITESLADLRTRWCTPGHHGGYRPTAAIRRAIEHRDRRCCFPGCRRPVRHCDADHTIPFHRGGATCPCNLAMLCRRHHKLKQTTGWRIAHIWPGVLLWITPSGHWSITAPADRE